jgi:hypothetical protein
VSDARDPATDEPVASASFYVNPSSECNDRDPAVVRAVARAQSGDMDEVVRNLVEL